VKKKHNKVQKKNQKEKEPINWGDEIDRSVKMTGKLFLKLFTFIINIILTVLLICLIAGCIVGVVFAMYIANNVDYTVDDIDILASEQNQTTKIFTVDEYGDYAELESQRLSAESNRMWVSLSEIPQDLQDAFIAIEDKRFWDHSGFDWITTIKATMAYFLPIGRNAGGSTITQQLIKNLTGDDDYTIQRKVQEILRAVNLEKVKDKEEILEMYLNTIYLSQGCEGVQAAANVYFNKDVSELTLLECAAIAGITQYPTKWDPIQNPENNKERRENILHQMYVQGFITQKEYEDNLDVELKIYKSYEDDNTDIEDDEEQVSSNVTSWYVDAVIDDCIDFFMEKYNCSSVAASKMLYSGGYSIIIAQDQRIQAILDKYYKDPDLFKAYDVVEPESSMIIIDPNNGNILGLVGGRGVKTQSRLLNRATSTTRSPGSTIKPLAVYAPAIEEGLITYSSVFDDTPFSFGTVTEKPSGNKIEKIYQYPSGWPSNYPAGYMGKCTLEYAIQVSKNTVAVKVLAELGIDKSFEFVHDVLNMTSFVGSGAQNDKALAPLALGGMTYGITLEELTSAYMIFPANGMLSNTRTVLKIIDSKGEVVWDNTPKTEIVISENTVQTMNKLLEAVVTKGTANCVNLRKSVDVAGKTGTTSADVDRWFVGYTPYYVAGIWFGYDIPSDLADYVYNEHTKVWDKIMTEVHQPIFERVSAGQEELKSLNDDLLIEAEYCEDSGKLATDACRADPRKGRISVGYFTKETLPTEACDCHVLVRYCDHGKGIAGPLCPEEDCIYVGLITVKDRIYPKRITVTDAQYVYIELPEGIDVCLDPTKPFFYNMFIATGEKLYDGNRAKSPFNKYCQSHYSTVLN